MWAWSYVANSKGIEESSDAKDARKNGSSSQHQQSRQLRSEAESVTDDEVSFAQDDDICFLDQSLESCSKVDGDTVDHVCLTNCAHDDDENDPAIDCIDVCESGVSETEESHVLENQDEESYSLAQSPEETTDEDDALGLAARDTESTPQNDISYTHGAPEDADVTQSQLPSNTQDTSSSALLGIDEDGEVIVTEEFPLADGFLLDDDTVVDALSLYQAIADKDESLLEAFRVLETSSTDTPAIKHDDQAAADAQQLKKGRTAISKASVCEQSDENQALFDILNRDFAAVTSRVSIGDTTLTSDELQLCFAAFVACFTPPRKTHYAAEYNHSLDEKLVQSKRDAKDDEQSDDDDSHNGPRQMSTEASLDEISHVSTAFDDAFPRPYVPVHIVNALWTEVLSCWLSKASSNASDAMDIPTSVLSFIRDSLALLGVLDVRNIAQDSRLQTEEGVDEPVLSVNDIATKAPGIKATGEFVEVVSVHQNIHQEYGDYLLSGRHVSEYKIFLEACAKRSHRAITRECSLNPGHSGDAGYAVQMLPWNMICGGNYRSAAELLTSKKFIHRRLQGLGILDGVTAHVTDVEELLSHVYGEACSDMTIPASNAAILDIYEQVRKGVLRQTKCFDEMTSPVTETISLHVSPTKLLQLDTGRALHMMGVSLGGHGFSDEALALYEEALRLKNAVADDTNPLDVTISDTVHCKGFALDTSGNYLQAMECYNEALELRRQSLGDVDLRVAETLHNKGAILCETGSCDAALVCLEESLQIRQFCLGDVHELCADTQQWMGNVMREWQRYEDAMAYFKTALQIKKATLGQDHEDVANTLQNVAIVLDDMSQYASSLGCYKEALRIYSLYHSRQSLPVADTMQFIANVYAVTEEHQHALDTFAEVAEIRESILSIEVEGVDNHQVYTVQALIAPPNIDHEDALRRFGKLLGCYEEVLPLTKLLRGTTDESLGTILRRMGELYWRLQDWDNAIGSFQGALRVHRALTVSPVGNVGFEICELLEKKGSAHLFRKEYQRAKTCFESVIQRRQKLDKTDHCALAFDMYCLGVAIHHLKTHKLALLAFTEALRLWKMYLGENDVLCGHALYWIGIQESELNHFDRALQLFRGALHTYKLNKAGLSYSVVINTLESLGDTHEKLNDPEMSLKSLNEAARLLRWHSSECNDRLGTILYKIGNLYDAEGNSAQSMEVFGEAIAVMRRQGRQDVLLCGTMERLGVLQGEAGKDGEAKDTLSEAYRLFESVVGQNNIRTATAVYRLGQVMDRLEAYDAAMQCYSECLRVQKVQLGLETKEVASTLVSMGINWNKRQKSKDAIDCLQQALSIQRAVHGDSGCEVAPTLHSLGRAYAAAGSLDKAVVCYKEAVRIRKATSPDVSDLPEIVFDMAYTEEQNGNHQAAITSYNEALLIWQENQPERVTIVMQRLGYTHEKKGEYQKAVNTLSQARNRLEGKQSHDQLVDIVGTLARCNASLEKYDLAIDEYQEHIALLRTIADGNDEKLADSLYALGTIHTRVGDLESAIHDFSDCLTMRKACYGKDDERVARVLINVSVVYEKLENLSCSDEQLREALSIFESVGNEKEMSVVLQSRGRVLTKLGDHRKSAECFQTALSIRRSLFGSNDAQVAILLYSCASAHLDATELIQASEYAQESLRIRTLKFGVDSVEAAQAQFLLGRILYEREDIDGAIRNLEHAHNFYKKSGDPTHQSLADCGHYLGRAYGSNKNHDAAVIYLTDALSIRTRLFGEDSIEVGDTCHHLGQSLSLVGKFKEALEAAVHALRIRKMKLGNDSLDCSQTLRLLGFIQEALGKNAEAVNCYIEALRVFTVVLGKNHADVASTLEKIGSLYLKASEYNKAIDNLKRALKIYNECPGAQGSEIARVLLIKGNVELRRDNGEVAIEDFKQSLQLCKQMEDQCGVAAALYEIGTVLESRGDNGEAMDCYREVFRIAADGGETAAKTHNRVGGIQAELEDYDAALSSFATALDLFKDLKGDGSMEEARTIHNIACVYEAQSDFDNSHSRFADALSIYKANLERDDLLLTGVMSDLGINCARRNDYPKALELCSEVLRVRKLKLGAQHLDSCDAIYNIANILDEWGKVDQAMKFYTEALQRYRSALGRDDIEVANCFQYIGMLHAKKGEDEFAVRAFTEALRIYEIEDMENLVVASVHFSLGRLQLKRNELDRSMHSFSSCFRIRQRELGDNNVDFGAVCEQIGDVYVAKHMNAEAKTFYEKALSVYKQSAGNDSVPFVRALARRASLLAQEEEGYDDALKGFRAALTVYKRAVGEETEEVADVLIKIGVIQNKRVDYEEAMKSLTSALKIRSSLFGREDERVAMTLFEIGSVLEEWGDSDEALGTYREVLRIIRLTSGHAHEMISKVHNRVGQMHMENEEYDAASQSFHAALDADRRLLGENATEVGHTLINIGGLHDAREEADAALASYSGALKIFRKKSGKDAAVALALNNIGINYARRRNYSKAIELCSEALRIRKLTLGDDHLDVADSCLNIANILDEWGKDEQSLKFYKEAMSLYRRRLGDNDSEVANCLQHLGSIHLKLNSPEKSITCFVESIRIYRVRGGDDSLDMALSLFNLGRIYGKRAEFDKSLACFKDCLRIRREVLGDQNLDVIAVHRYIDAIKRKMRR